MCIPPQDSVQRHRKNRHDRTTNPNFDYEAWKQKHMAFADQHVPKWIVEVVERYGQSFSIVDLG